VSVDEVVRHSDTEELVPARFDLRQSHHQASDSASVRWWPRIDGHDGSEWPKESELERFPHRNERSSYDLSIRYVPSGRGRTTRPEQPEPERPVQEVFRELAEKWRRETRLSSRIERQTAHPAYLQIIGLGPEAVRLILRELENPASLSENLAQTREVWLKWGRERGLIGGAI
jgi:hypothetical protein